MKKNILTIRNFDTIIHKYYLVFIITLLSSLAFGQTMTPIKTVTASTNNCRILDVQLKITGTNPPSRNADVVLVIDVSGSMNNTINGDSKKSMQYAREAAKSFINAAASNPNNRISIVSYTDNAKVESSFLYLTQKNIATLKNIINNLTPKNATNIQDGIVKASNEINTNGRFDCTTARSIILLTDGIANKTGPKGSTTSCSITPPSTTNACVVNAITAATAAKTTIKSSTTYNNQIFAVGLIGGITGDINDSSTPSQKYVAKYTLDKIQGSPAITTNSGSNLTSIYSNIATKIIWVAQNLIETETIPNGYTISDVNTDKGTYTVSGQQIKWDIDFLNSETTTLNYKLTPPNSVCGNQVVGSSSLTYKNTTCTASSMPITTPSVFLSCPVVTLASQVNINCFGTSTGAITLNDATGGTSPYTYDWLDLAGTNDTKNRTSLAAGTYTVTATDKNGCSTTALKVTIGQPEAALALGASSKTDACCFGASTGSVTAGTVTGAVGTVTYSWKNASNTVVGSTASVSNLPAGTYTVTVSDSCSSEFNSVTVGQPEAALALGVSSKTDACCFGASTGSVTAGAVTGAVGTVTYSWKDASNTVVGSTATVDNLPAGTYTLTVSDSCSSESNSVTIGQPEAALALGASSKTDASCFGASTGAVTAGAVTGAVGTVTYSWKNASNTVVGSTATVDNLPAGTYTVTVSDSCSSVSNSVTVGQPAAALALAVSSKTDTSCFGASTGSVTAGAVTGAVGTVTYSWKNASNTVVGSTASVDNLPAGTYTVTVSDSCSSESNSVTVGQPEAALSATSIIINNNNCVGCNNGAIDITVNGGTKPYQFLWSNGATSEDIDKLASGNYSVIITDNKGCSIEYNYVINESGIEITKDGVYVDSNNDGITNVGDVVAYSFIVKNTGNVTLTNVTVLDNNATIVGGPIASLAVGATDTTTFTATHQLTQNEIDKGIVYNIALVRGYDPEEKSVTDTSIDTTPCIKCPRSLECPDCTITELNQNPSIDITKDGVYVDSNNDGKTNVGDIVSYNFVIKNTGNITLTNVTVTDNNATISGGPIATLAVGATDATTFSGNHIITQEDINTGYVYNLATATGKDPKGNPVTDTSSDPTPCTSCPVNPECTDCTITPLTQTPSIDVIKIATSTSFNKVGDIVNYVITMKNTGNVILSNVNITDPLTGFSTIIENLNVGQILEYNQSYTITQLDLDKGSVLNIASASGKDPKGNTISDEDSEIVNEKANTIDAIDDNVGTVVGVNQITPNVINVFTNDTLNTTAVNPSDVILTAVTSNPFLIMNPDGSIDVLPNAPVGTLTLTYQICEKLNTSNCDTAVVTVIIEAPSMTVSGESICVNDVPYFKYTTTANNFTPVNGLTITWKDSNNNIVSTMTNLPLNGQVLWPGAVVDANGNGTDWPGWILVNDKWIEGADGFENLRPTATISLTLNPTDTLVVSYPPSTPFCTSRPTFKIDAIDDTAGPINVLNGVNNVINIFKNDTLNTVLVNPDDIILSLVTPDPTGYITMNADGSIDLKDGTPAGTYILTYQICEKAKPSNCDTAIVTITVICNDQTKIAGIVINEGTKKPLANVPVTLIPQGTTTGSVQIRITNAEGYYNFTGMVPGDYLVQVQDANLNAAYQLYPTTSSLFFTTLENCKYQNHDFGYDKSNLPVLGDFVWYDINNNGLQDEWFDANNDNVVTKNVPDANGSFDYSKWEWIDLNGDGSYKGILNVGELNAAGFGNAKSANVFVTGPSNYSDSVIIGIQGFWRNRPTTSVFGEYKVELKMDSNLEAQSSAMGATGLVKVLPNTDRKIPESKTTAFEVCGPTNNTVQTANLTSTNQVNLDLDFGISCKLFANIQASNDTYNVTQCSIANEIRNALANDLLNGSPADIAKFKFKLLTALSQFIIIDDNGNITLTDDAKAGIFKFEYQVCEAANPTNCSTATITINITGIEPVTINSTACNADTSPLDLNSLLPAGIPTDGTWIDTDNTGGLNGSILNTFGIPTNKYNYEYKIGGLCPRSIFLILDVNFDCKVLGCGTIIVHNAFSPNGDGLNDIFKIDSIDDTICYPENTIEIYNRWGVLVFETKNYNNTSNYFDGVSRGRTTVSQSSGLPNGTYFYILNYTSFDLNGNPVQNKKDGYLYLSK